MSRRTLAAALVALAVLVGAGAVVGFTSGTVGRVLGEEEPRAATATSRATAPAATPAQPAPGYYLALGDSLAAGFQNGVDHRTEGYVGAVRQAVEKRHGPTELVNLACSGETTTTMLDGGGCTYDRGTQLAQAEKFLRDHPAQVRLVTLDIGGNDVARCGFGGLKPSCTTPALATLSGNLPQITTRLRKVAPGVQVVVLNYYDPFLVLDLLGSSGLGQTSVTELGKVNGAIARSAGASGARVADVASAFQTTVRTPVTVTDVGKVPTNLARILQWTWMAPPRFDFHANDTGYAVMARAVVEQLR